MVRVPVLSAPQTFNLSLCADRIPDDHLRDASPWSFAT